MLFTELYVLTSGQEAVRADVRRWFVSFVGDAEETRDAVPWRVVWHPFWGDAKVWGMAFERLGLQRGLESWLRGPGSGFRVAKSAEVRDSGWLDSTACSANGLGTMRSVVYVSVSAVVSIRQVSRNYREEVSLSGSKTTFWRLGG